MPGNLCTPDYLADTARDIAKRYGMKVTVLGRAEMEQERMGSFLCVAQGTPQDPKLIALEYRGGATDAKPVVLVGKGLCFDTRRHLDQAGAGHGVDEVRHVRRGRRARRHGGDRRAWSFRSTSSVSSARRRTCRRGTAVKPGDVVQASNGKFIEIINTDAEGRLVLADVLAYAKRFEPAAVDRRRDADRRVRHRARAHGDRRVSATTTRWCRKCWPRASAPASRGGRLPLWDEYKELIKSDVADIKNTGGRAGGHDHRGAVPEGVRRRVSVGASRHRGNGVHGVGSRHRCPRGPTGVPVGTFVEFVRGRAR